MEAQWNYNYVSGFEKRAHFLQRSNFCF